MPADNRRVPFQFQPVLVCHLDQLPGRSGSPVIPSSRRNHPWYIASVGNLSRSAGGQSADQAGNIPANMAARLAMSGRRAHETWRKYSGGRALLAPLAHALDADASMGSQDSMRRSGNALIARRCILRR